AEVEDVRAFHEEGPMLGQELLERREVHERRVELSLSEIRVDGGVEGQEGADAVFQIEACVPRIRTGLREGIADGALGLEGPRPRRVGKQLEAPGRRNILEAAEVREARHESVFRLSDEGKQVELVLPENGADEADTPDLVGGAGKAQLRERDLFFSRPSERVDRRDR